ncbi:hypothetical protein [Anaerotruncus sp.]|nr:hypothetical protein [Anaerotruncus sp.]
MDTDKKEETPVLCVCTTPGFSLTKGHNQEHRFGQTLRGNSFP